MEHRMKVGFPVSYRARRCLRLKITVPADQPRVAAVSAAINAVYELKVPVIAVGSLDNECLHSATEVSPV